MKTWLEPLDSAAPDDLRQAVGGHPLVAEMLARRGIHGAAEAQAFLDPADYKPAPPLELPGVQTATERLLAAIQRGEAICVWGDFDVDGQTATSVLVSALRRLGAKVSYHIPVRAKESHGVNLPVLKQVLDGGAQLLLTCDTGIAAHDEVEYANSRGVNVIITDHHDLPLTSQGEPRLPPALAVVNPKLLPEGHPLGTLPGVGVAYKLVEALFEQAGRAGEWDEYLDLVALGIVADIALQRGDARYLLQRGLEVLRQARRPGLQAIFEYAGIQPAVLNEDHIGYELAPRLNALGRLGDANPAVELLTTTDGERARVLALELEGLNARRKLLTSQVLQGALAQIAQEPALLAHAALVLAHPTWPAGVIGIVAGQLAERFNRPVVLLASPPDEMARGSARSVEGVNINLAIAAHSQLLGSFGGHPMAAGLSISSERIPEFRRCLSRTVEKMLGEVAREASLQIDAYLPLAEMTPNLAADLERLAPFGAGNPPLVLASRGLVIVSETSLGRSGEHRLVRVEDEVGAAYRVVWWQGAGWPLPEGRFDLAYAARISTYRGAGEVQIEWLDARETEERSVEAAVQRPPIEVVDLRGAAHPLPVLQRLAAEGVQVWREAEAVGKVDGHDRYALQPSDALAIWTPPPGPAELRRALEEVVPRKVYLFCVYPQAGGVDAFLQRLSGLLKFALNQNQGRTRISTLATATGQREAAVQLGLDCLRQGGFIRQEETRGQEIQVARGASPSRMPPEQLAALKAVLEETAAFRAYYQRADKEALVANNS